MHIYDLTALLLTIIFVNLTCTYVKGQGLFLSEQQKRLEAARPIIEIPDSFQIKMTTNDYALNLTELVYFDKPSGRIRLQFFYSFMGLEPTKGLDMVLELLQDLIAVQTDGECKYTTIINRPVIPVNDYIQLFNFFTDYLGTQVEGLEGYHVFKIK